MSNPKEARKVVKSNQDSGQDKRVNDLVDDVDPYIYPHLADM